MLGATVVFLILHNVDTANSRRTPEAASRDDPAVVQLDGRRICDPLDQQTLDRPIGKSGIHVVVERSTHIRVVVVDPKLNASLKATSVGVRVIPPQLVDEAHVGLIFERREHLLTDGGRRRLGD